MIRIGEGFDVHALQAERDLILGGKLIPYDRGLAGHSDADVLTHAIMDAILGALALGDIGQWFPDNNNKYKNANSISLLKEIINDPRVNKWTLSNLDCTIIAEAPKMASSIPQMRKNIAEAFATSIDNISIKATTTEKLGYTGRSEGIAAKAIVLLTL